MGIYIKGMKMPKDDETIRFIKLLNGKTVAVKEKVKSFGDMYDIIEVTKPHGPLIDVDREIKMIEMTESQPKRGEWEEYNNYMKRCSECGWIHDILHYGNKFCPNCGAKMKGVDNERDN